MIALHFGWHKFLNGAVFVWLVSQQQGRTAVFAAAEMGWTAAIEELVRLGAKLNTVLQVRSVTLYVAGCTRTRLTIVG